MTINCLSCNNKFANFNFHKEIKAKYCKTCSTNGMIGVQHPKCIVCNMMKRQN